MSKVSIFREHSLMGIILKGKIYINRKLAGSVGNCKVKVFNLPPGEYEIYVRYSQLYIPHIRRNKGLMHSNTLHLKVADNQEYNLDLFPHPLYGYGRHHPSIGKLLRPVETMLLLDQSKGIDSKVEEISRIGSQIKDELKRFKYHPITLALMIGVCLFAMVTNTLVPEIYGGNDGLPWGFMFGFSGLIGLFLGSAKQMLAGGWEHKMLLYSALGSLFILMTLPSQEVGYRILYVFAIAATSFWAYFCYKNWQRNKRGLDALEESEAKFERQF